MPSLEGSTILVTGGAGTIGSHVVDALLDERVRRVIVFDNFSEGRIENLATALADGRVEVEVVSADIRSREDLDEHLAGVDYVFHEASVLLLESMAKPQKAIEVNIQGTFNLLQACTRHGVKKLVWASSASVFGDPVRLPVDEEHPLNNRTFYGATKVACEQMATNFHYQHGLKQIGLRYYNVYGPRQGIKGAYAQVLPRWLDRLDAGQPIVIFGDGTQSMDLIYVEDIARANVLAMKSEVANDFFNIGTGVETTVKELAEIVLEVTGAKSRILFEPHDVNLVKRRRCSTTKAQSLIGFRSQVAPREGVQRFVEWRRGRAATPAPR